MDHDPFPVHEHSTCLEANLLTCSFKQQASVPKSWTMITLSIRVALGSSLFAISTLMPFAARVAEAADTSGYTLFDPTPDSMLRDLSTDRPGAASSPFTVDAGHIQVETGVWSYSWDHWSPDASLTRSRTLFSTNVKLGLTDWADFDVVIPVSNSIVTRTPIGPGQSSRSSAQGFGDVLVGTKVNFSGNDNGEKQGFGLLGYVKVPTAASGLGNSMAEFTLVAPYSFDLPKGFSMTVQPGVGLLRNGQKQGYHGDYQLAAEISHSIFGSTTLNGQLGITLDREGDHNSSEQDSIAPALQWLIRPWLQLDGGLTVGIARAATDWTPYAGLSFRY